MSTTDTEPQTCCEAGTCQHDGDTSRTIADAIEDATMQALESLILIAADGTPADALVASEVILGFVATLR